MRRLYLVSAIFLALAGASTMAVADVPQAELAMLSQTTTQLPRGVVPTHYDVTVTPHAQSMTFDGQVTVTIDVLKPTSSITLNAIDLTFTKVEVLPVGGKPLGTPKVSIDAQNQTATFALDHPLAAGSYRLAMTYSGKIGTQANGLFALDYDSKSGKKRALYTQFENSDARRFIPSWDEPAYKATFDLKAIVPGDEMAVSNMPVATRKDLGKGLAEVQFKQTPKMSSYLLFFGLGDFDRVTTHSDGTEIGVITQKGMASQGQFTLDSASAVLHEYNNYFGIPYPLPKLDNIAAPGQSQFFSAMENWGAIFTFEYALLLDPKISTVGDKEEVFNTAAHEMAHQWFGDLVTMSWWDSLWLNEGFASWMAARTTEKLHPEWNTVLDDVGTRDAAMSRDAMATTHPIIQKIDTVEQANQAFDTITYAKGEAVIRMLEAYVGSDVWRNGVRQYIKAHEYGNTVSDDLWRSVQAAAGNVPVTDIAHDFTLQPGVPLIRVAAATCKGGNTLLDLDQGEFSRDQPDKKPLTWHVPVMAQTVGHPTARVLISGGHGTLSVPGCGTVLLNVGQSGYYRTLYTADQLAALTRDYSRLAPIDQLGLLNEAWALGMAGTEPVSVALDFSAAVPDKADPTLWAAVSSGLAGLDSLYKGDKSRQDRFRAYATKRLDPEFARIGWDAKPGESVSTTLLRTQLLGALSALDDQTIINEARRRYASNDMPAPLRKTILSIVAGHADAATWDKLHAQAKAEQTPMIKSELYALLSTVRDDALAQRALDLALTDEPGATSSASMIRIVAGKHSELAFDFAQAHRAQVDKLIDSTSRSQYYPGLGSGSFDPKMIDKVNAYANQYIAPGARRVADTVVANIKYHIKVRNERLPQVDAWLAKHGG